MAKDMYQKRKQRQNNKANDDNNTNESKMNINWYPGHMVKAKKQIIEDLKLIDVVVEVLDARIPLSSRNPDINEIVKEKNKVIILNKSDLADEKTTKIWKKYFEDNNINAVITDSNSGKGIDETIKAIEKISKDDKDSFAERGRTGKSTRILVLGIPNVGKSSFINRITKKTSAEVGNKPGVTKRKQWVRVNGSIELMDTPGVLWPKFDNEEIALNLAYTGTIKDDILQKTEVAFLLLKYLLENNMEDVANRYKIDKDIIKQYMEVEDLEENEKILHIMYAIGKKRGAIVSGGHVDEEKTSNIILDDFRSGKIGRISLEKPKGL